MAARRTRPQRLRTETGLANSWPGYATARYPLTDPRQFDILQPGLAGGIKCNSINGNDAISSRCSAARRSHGLRRASAAASDRVAGIQQRVEPLDIFSSAAGPDRPVTQILQSTTFLEARVLLLHNCPNLSSQKRCGHRTRCRCANRWEVKSLTRLRM
jgi:hypothetical protein